MFQKEQLELTKQIQEILQDLGIPLTEGLDWTPIPFSGEWGLATSFFATAALEARSGKSVQVPQRAEEIAALVAKELPAQTLFPRVEALK